MENLGINVGQILAQVVNFFVIFFIFKKFVYARVINTLDERKKKIADSMSKAEEIDKREIDFTNKTKKHEEALTLEAHKLKQQMVRDAEDEAKDILKKAQAEAKKIKALALSDSKAYLEHAHEVHDKEIAAQALELSKKAMAKLLSEKSQKEITQKKIKELLSS